ncbi:hypothetical protein NIES4072_24990 [Nostoc commune NIES-4072]|uniref:Uncharacterized protein n=1 Tax=Nostoc commune NIES-4072 TaxID=2005467 RepID=A0A2R5FT35_NOSCO|nr:hypothetical protein NIES4070_01870 [Nostoc commune HK-02]GBG18834.1 hypothetical protein NIES4072_24990 [Nostoc commune NIES-4072]
MQNYFSRKIIALTANKEENLQAPLFEELLDSETSKIVGGASLQPTISISEEVQINIGNIYSYPSSASVRVV